MTKIGEGKQIPEGPTPHKDIRMSADKFLNALESFDGQSTDTEKEHLKAIMDQQMELIQGAIAEIKTKGMHKQGVLFKKDYDLYMQETSSQNFSALEHDIATLREYNDIS
jgi:hypothetical protein